MTKLRQFLQRLDLCLYILRKGDTDMAIIYATLIIKGVKTFSQVPACIKDKVKDCLVDLDVPELAETGTDQ